ncbi:MAG TPA: TetR/AcrR family transcriptional regulator [Acidimicrobiales bacterium]|nr:TetR/AcrR family transcriptional regulator [Acidimicrobiales bacterium]
MSETSVIPSGGALEAPRPPGRPRDEQATEAITAAALRQLEEVGYASMSVESIAAEAGVARATVYRRFRDKADVVTAAIAANPGGLLPSVPSADPRGDLVRFLEEFDQRFGESCVEVVGTLLGSRHERAALELHRRRVVHPRMGYARALVVRAQELGTLRADLDADLAVQMLAGSVFARRLGGFPSDPDWARRAVAMIWGAFPPS